MTEEQRRKLEQHREVREWLIQSGGREATRRHYLLWLGKFVQFSGFSPDEMLELKSEALRKGKPKSVLESKIIEWIGELQEHYSEATVNLAYTAVRSFMSYNGYELPRKLVRIGLTLEKSLRVPEQHEVETMIGYATDIQQKALLTVMSETPCRPRIFSEIKWGWLESEWEKKDVVHIRLPKEFRPTTRGSKKFEPLAFICRKSVDMLKKLREFQRSQGISVTEEDKIFPLTPSWVRTTVHRIYTRAVRDKAIRPSRPDEQPLSAKSFRKYVFNAIDACRDIGPEWRSMLKGRDLNVERYYSAESIEKLREIYRFKVYPEIWREPSVTMDQARKRAIMDFARLQGVPEEKLREIERIDLMTVSAEDLMRKLKPLLERKTHRPQPNGGKPLYETRIVTEDELVPYLNKGWNIIKELTNGKIVIRRINESAVGFEEA